MNKWFESGSMEHFANEKREQNYPEKHLIYIGKNSLTLLHETVCDQTVGHKMFTQIGDDAQARNVLNKWLV